MDVLLAEINALVAGSTILLAALQKILAKSSCLLENFHPLPKIRSKKKT